MSFSFIDSSGSPKSRSASYSRNGDNTKPIVILLHGAGGTKESMENPGHNFDFSGALPPDQDLGNFYVPAAGPYGRWNLDALKTVISWRRVLNDSGFRTVNYSQVDPSGLLTNPALELAALVSAIRALPDATDAKLVLLAHSRGGLLARKFIKDNRNSSDLVGNITKIITLHSPHVGSWWANDKTEMNALLNSAIALTPPPFQQHVAQAIAPLLSLVSASPAHSEMRVGGVFLESLADGEAPLPGVEYHTFGGTSTIYSRVVSWRYTSASGVPRFPPADPPFNHRIAIAEARPPSPLFELAPSIHAEITLGKGDILVSDERSRLPFATHHTNHLNHAEALWDPSLQAQVLEILTSTSSINMAHAILFEHADFRGAHKHLFKNEGDLGRWWDNSLQDTASSIVVLEGQWEFFADNNFRDKLGPTLGPGVYPNIEATLGPRSNDRISSLRPIA